jgi:hypothetical protein
MPSIVPWPPRRRTGRITGRGGMPEPIGLPVATDAAMQAQAQTVLGRLP